MGLCLSSKQHPAKKITAYAHLIRSVGPFIMHNEDIFWSFDRGIRFCVLYNKITMEYHLCKQFKFYAHAQQLKNEED